MTIANVVEEYFGIKSFCRRRRNILKAKSKIIVKKEAPCHSITWNLMMVLRNEVRGTKSVIAKKL